MTILDAVVLTLPLLGGLLTLRGAESMAARVVLACYVYPMIVTLMVASPGYSMPTIGVAEGSGNLVRAGLHLFMLWLLGLAVLWRQRISVTNGTVMAVACAACALMAVSVVLAGSPGALAPGLLRAGLLGVLGVNTLILIPTLIGDRGDLFVRDFAKGLYGLMLGVTCVALYVRLIYGPYPEWSPRLGRPMNPRVLAELLLLAVILITLTTNKLRHGVFLAIFVVASGSRLAILVTGAFLLWFALVRRRHLAVLGLITVAGVVAATMVGSQGLGVFARSDLFAGRLLLWGVAIARLPEVWVWGTGERFTLPVETDDPLLEISRLHNGPLEAIMSHGVWYAAAGVVLYLLLAFRLARRVEGREAARRLGLWVLSVALLESIIGTSFWTNLGDTFSLVVLVVLSVLVHDLRRAVPVEATR